MDMNIIWKWTRTWKMDPIFQPNFSNQKILFSSLSLLFLLSSLSHKKRRWMMKNIQTKKQRNFLKVLRMEMKKLWKFFFLETKTNNSNLISTSNSKKGRLFFSNSISLSLSCCLMKKLSKFFFLEKQTIRIWKQHFCFCSFFNNFLFV